MWAYLRTPGGAVKLKDFDVGSGDAVHELVDVNGTCFFLAADTEKCYRAYTFA